MVALHGQRTSSHTEAVLKSKSTPSGQRTYLHADRIEVFEPPVEQLTDGPAALALAALSLAGP